MFHHQKSSRSSDENLQINLLKSKNRQSGVSFVRFKHNNIRLNRSKRGSAHVPRSGEFEDDVDNNHYDNYSALDNVDFSESLLTSPNENSPAVGLILFILLIVFTPLETFALYASQQKLEIDFILTMLEWLILCELISFSILYQCKWVERVTILTAYLRSRAQYKEQPMTILGKIASHPYLLLLVVLVLTFIWEISYANAILDHDSIAHLILLYFIILPEIVGSLLYEQELGQDRTLRVVYYGATVYLTVCGFIANIWVGLGGLSGMFLICLSIRFGRVILFMEYISKLILLVLVVGLHAYGNSLEDPDYDWEGVGDGSISSVILLLGLTTFSIILVRCINNKILRVQLYKYFYSDQTINNFLLCLPLLLGFVENSTIDIWIALLGCGVFLVINYQIGRRKQEISINLGEPEPEKEEDRTRERELQRIR